MNVSPREAYFVPNRVFRPASTNLFKSADAPPDAFMASAPNNHDNGLIPRPQNGGPTLQDRPYYDTAADQSAQQTYYEKLELSSDGEEAFHQLSRLVRESHTTRLDYAPDKYVYPWVDRRPNGQVESIYSPESVVRLTPAKTQAIDGAMAQMVAFAPLAPETVAAHMTLVQAAGSLNCEHVVPQSWYDAKEPMRGDLHHLFACDSRCNSFRGNRAYRESVNLGTDTVAQCGIRTDEDKGFKPMAGHGAVARATLYFLIRYPKKASGYSSEDIQTLVQWSQDEPPSLYEKHRNAAIQEMQGNRNPFIDHPDWVGRVNFEPGLRKHPTDN